MFDRQKRAFRLDEMAACDCAHARLRQCPCQRASAFTHVLINSSVNVFLCATASVAMPCLRPRPNERKRKCAFYGGETGMDADADRISEHDRMEKRSKMCVWPRRNGQLQIFRQGRNES